MISKISLIVPVFNEIEEIENFFIDLEKCNFNLINEILFINDCSTDNSKDILEENIEKFKKSYHDVNLILIDNIKNRGYGFSIKKGVNKSKNDIIAIIDLDGTYKIEDLNKISYQFTDIQKLKYDLIIGERKIDTSNTSRLKIIGKK